MADKPPQKSWQARPEFNERRYRRVDTRVWNDARVRGFSPNGRLVWVLLLTAPSTTSIPGLFRMREEEGAALCGLSLEEFRIGYQEGYRLGLVEADWAAGVVWLKKAARYEWPTSPKIVATWRKVLRAEIPESPLVARAMAAIHAELLSVFEDPSPFSEAYAEAFPIPYAIPYAIPYQEGYPAQYAVSRMQDAGSSFPPPAVASATSGQGDLLPSGPPTPPAKPVKKVREAKKPPPDATEPKPFTAACDMLTRVYAEVRRADYGFGLDATRNGKAVRELLWGAGAKAGEDHGDPLVPLEEIERRWRTGLAWKGFPACNAIWDLREHWAAYAQPQDGRAAPDNLRPAQPDTCAGCGTRCQGGAVGEPEVWLGYECGCLPAFTEAQSQGLHFTKAAEWAATRKRAA